MIRYVDILGRELANVHEWEALFVDMHYRRVGHTRVGDVEVSTVWLGLEMWGGYFFETMIFGGPLDQEQWRYQTHAEACAGHDAIVALVHAESQL